jgi:glycosyltransferase involved in cell wall biosynthesis
MIRFTVILPVRNGMPYVKECVESVLGQTYPHLDLLVLDNASTDDTVPWVKQLSDPRIRVERSERSLSIEESWGRVPATRRYEYMTLIGHDDYFDPTFLERIVALIDANPDASLYQTGARLIDSEGRTLRKCRPVPPRESASDYLRARLTYNRDVFGTGYVMRTADYDKVGGIPPFERLLFADDALIMSLTAKSYKACDPRPSFAVRLHPKSESATLPNLWSSMAKGMGQFSSFLSNFIRKDPQSAAVLAAEGPAYMIRFHEYQYIYALIGASQRGQVVDEAARELLRAQIQSLAPEAAYAFGRSPKVRIIEALNKSPFRGLVAILWRLYQPLKIRFAL